MSIKKLIMTPINFLYSPQFLIPTFIILVGFFIFFHNLLTGVIKEQRYRDISNLPVVEQKRAAELLSKINIIRDKISTQYVYIRGSQYSAPEDRNTEKYYLKIKKLKSDMEPLIIERNKILSKGEYSHWSMDIVDWLDNKYLNSMVLYR